MGLQYYDTLGSGKEGANNGQGKWVEMREKVEGSGKGEGIVRREEDMGRGSEKLTCGE